MTHPFTNELINETSPYLLQHAHNPIHWKAWNESTLDTARKENKLIIISVGYAACHWCHVMEHESFEDIEVAQVMNTHFVNIKVDREERPDVDQVYMNAVQLLTGSGGWPLNVVALPDGRPVWGGTYFKKNQWINVLNQLADLYVTNPKKMLDYASKLQEGIKSLDIVNLNTTPPDFDKAFIKNTVDQWSPNFDHAKGGTLGAPKFMMPNNLHFLLRYAFQSRNTSLMTYIDNSLKQMAYGGIYDQIGGGFARYSVDDRWHVPHFEKMLYDNAQLVSLYCDAFSVTQNPLYKTIVLETLQFVERELTAPDGMFYSSLDADSINSEGTLEEGAFYVWKEKELKDLLQEDYNLFSAYYNINDYGYWEHGNYVLIRNSSNSDFTKTHQLDPEILQQKIDQWKHLLLQHRDKRPQPRLDDKTLTSWNALMLKAYIDAYKVFKDESFKKIALKNAGFILNKQLKEDGGLYHNYKNGKSTINGYLEDYALVIDALIALHSITSDTQWLIHARDLTNYCFDYFFDENSQMFFFTSKADAALISRTIEYRDNVIPSSNSVMAKNLFKLSLIFGNNSYKKTAETMLNNMHPNMKQYPSAFSNWLDLMLNLSSPFYEIAIVGDECLSISQKMQTNYLPNTLMVSSLKDSSIALLKQRYIDTKTMIYVCVNNTCNRPVETAEDALNIMTD